MASESGRDEKQAGRRDWSKPLVWISVGTGQALISQSEWQLARAVGWPRWVAWCAPVALGAYVLAAMLAGRGLRGAVATSAVSVLMSHGVYAADRVWASLTIGTRHGGHLMWPLAAGCSVVPLLVMYRVHGLLERKRRVAGVAKSARPPVPMGEPVATPAPAKVATRPPSQVAILRALDGHDGRARMAEVVLASGLPRSTAKKAMDALMDAGLVARVAEGVYERTGRAA